MNLQDNNQNNITQIVKEEKLENNNNICNNSTNNNINDIKEKIDIKNNQDNNLRKNNDINNIVNNKNNNENIDKNTINKKIINASLTSNTNTIIENNTIKDKDNMNEIKNNTINFISPNFFPEFTFSDNQIGLTFFSASNGVESFSDFLIENVDRFSFGAEGERINPENYGKVEYNNIFDSGDIEEERKRLNSILEIKIQEETIKKEENKNNKNIIDNKINNEETLSRNNNKNSLLKFDEFYKENFDLEKDDYNAKVNQSLESIYKNPLKFNNESIKDINKDIFNSNNRNNSMNIVEKNNKLSKSSNIEKGYYKKKCNIKTNVNNEDNNIDINNNSEVNIEEIKRLKINLISKGINDEINNEKQLNNLKDKEINIEKISDFNRKSKKINDDIINEIKNDVKNLKINDNNNIVNIISFNKTLDNSNNENNLDINNNINTYNQKIDGTTDNYDTNQAKCAINENIKLLKEKILNNIQNKVNTSLDNEISNFSIKKDILNNNNKISVYNSAKKDKGYFSMKAWKIIKKEDEINKKNDDNISFSHTKSIKKTDNIINDIKSSFLSPEQIPLQNNIPEIKEKYIPNSQMSKENINNSKLNPTQKSFLSKEISQNIKESLNESPKNPSPQRAIKLNKATFFSPSRNSTHIQHICASEDSLYTKKKAELRGLRGEFLMAREENREILRILREIYGGKLVKEEVNDLKLHLNKMNKIQHETNISISVPSKSSKNSRIGTPKKTQTKHKNHSSSLNNNEFIYTKKINNNNNKEISLRNYMIKSVNNSKNKKSNNNNNISNNNSININKSINKGNINCITKRENITLSPDEKESLLYVPSNVNLSSYPISKGKMKNNNNQYSNIKKNSKKSSYYLNTNQINKNSYAQLYNKDKCKGKNRSMSSSNIGCVNNNNYINNNNVNTSDNINNIINNINNNLNSNINGIIHNNSSKKFLNTGLNINNNINNINNNINQNVNKNINNLYSSRELNTINIVDEKELFKRNNKINIIRKSPSFAKNYNSKRKMQSLSTSITNINNNIYPKEVNITTNNDINLNSPYLGIGLNYPGYTSKIAYNNRNFIDSFNNNINNMNNINGIGGINSIHFYSPSYDMINLVDGRILNTSNYFDSNNLNNLNINEPLFYESGPRTGKNMSKIINTQSKINISNIPLKLQTNLQNKIHSNISSKISDIKYKNKLKEKNKQINDTYENSYVNAGTNANTYGGYNINNDTEESGKLFPEGDIGNNFHRPKSGKNPSLSNQNQGKSTKNSHKILSLQDFVGIFDDIKKPSANHIQNNIQKNKQLNICVKGENSENFSTFDKKNLILTRKRKSKKKEK